MKRITIIGGGASGTLLAINLIKSANNQPLTINLIEKSRETGRGVAYGTAKDFHLLNVRANKMGAFADNIEHFSGWLQEKKYHYSPEDFVSRKIYGSYLQDVFAQSILSKPFNVSVNMFKIEAVDVINEGKKTFVLLANGDKVWSDKIVLAFGNFLPPHVRTETDDYQNSPHYLQNPWRKDIPEAIQPDANVLIIGTGLTGIDVILSLFSHNHRGKIYALSTHGLFPTVHAKPTVYPSFQSEIEAVSTVRERLKIVHWHIKKAEADGGDWRAVIDILRPFTQELWKSFPQVEKLRFMRHLQRRWDVARHRMPPECWEILQDLQGKEQLEVLKGRIRRIESDENGSFEISFGKDQKVSANWIINCTGSQSNYEKIDALLVRNLMTEGEIRNDALNLGLDATADGRIINRDGEISETLLTFATAQKGILWECVAMPDIRLQAQELARKLLA